MARRELVGREGLVRTEDRPAVPNDHRAAADRVGNSRPVGPQDHAHRHERPDRSLCDKPLRGGAARDEHGAVPGNGRSADTRERDDRPCQIGIRRRRRERLNDHLGHASRRRRGRPVAGREERDPVLPRRLVHVGERPALTEAAPGPEELDATDVERPVRRQSDARPVAQGRAVDDAVSHQHAARPAGVRRVEVAVDADHRARGREPPLHRGDLLDPENRLVRKHRAERVETRRARADDDMHRDRTVRCELNRLLIGDARHQRRRLS